MASMDSPRLTAASSQSSPPPYGSAAAGGGGSGAVAYPQQRPYGQPSFHAQHLHAADAIHPSAAAGYYAPAPAPAPAAPANDTNLKMRVMVGVVLAALTALAAYYCLTSGFNALDVAKTSFETFKGGALVYLGAVFSFVAVANIVYTAYKAGFSDSKYEKDFMKKQIAATVMAPVIMIPFAVVAGIKVAMTRR